MEMRYGSLYQTKEKERLYDESLLISLFFSPLPQSFHQLYLSLDISFSLYISLYPPHYLYALYLILFPRIYFFVPVSFSSLPTIFLYHLFSFPNLFQFMSPNPFPLFSLQISRYVSLYIYLQLFISYSLSFSASIYLSVGLSSVVKAVLHKYNVQQPV